MSLRGGSFHSQQATSIKALKYNEYNDCSLTTDQKTWDIYQSRIQIFDDAQSLTTEKCFNRFVYLSIWNEVFVETIPIAAVQQTVVTLCHVGINSNTHWAQTTPNKKTFYYLLHQHKPVLYTQYFLNVLTSQTHSWNCFYYTKNLHNTINARKNWQHIQVITSAITNSIQQVLKQILIPSIALICIVSACYGKGCWCIFSMEVTCMVPFVNFYVFRLILIFQWTTAASIASLT